MCGLLVAIGLVLLSGAPAGSQSSATLQGRVLDRTGGVVVRATVTVRGRASGFHRSIETDRDGRYRLASMPAGAYDVVASARGFRTETVEALAIEVGRTIVRDFRLEVGPTTETVVVQAEPPVVERATSSLGHVVTTQAVHEVPLNGRRFTDLGLLVPGSVAPSQTGFSTTPIRGVGAMAINTAGHREEAVAFVVNGISTNNLTFGSLSFQPSVSSIQEFTINNSTFSAEHGHVSGAIVGIVTRSGTEAFHGELFELFRDDALDARNYFETASAQPPPFRRNQFGGAIGGPMLPRNMFFFATYEGFRQRQGLAMNSLVLSDQQRVAVTHPVVGRLVDLIPRANATDADGTPRFIGSADAIVQTNRWSGDVTHNLGARGRLHVFFSQNRVNATEPRSNGNSIPGFGHTSATGGSILTVVQTQVLGQRTVNEVRAGRSTLFGRISPTQSLNPAALGIETGVDRPIGLPQMMVAGGLNFGGPMQYPQGRTDASFIVSDTLHLTRGRHSVKLGGEYRSFLNENFAQGSGFFNFPTVDAFLAGTANAFGITLGERRNAVRQRAAALFVQDTLSIRWNLTIDVGLRWEWHVTPTERDNRFVVFDAASASLVRVGQHIGAIYAQNHRNVEPRLGLVWDAAQTGRTVVRAAYGVAVDEPGTTAVRDTASNPPFAMPLAAQGTIALDTAIATTQPAGVSPVTVDPRFRNASMRSWNVNVQRRLTREVAATVGYMGTRGKNLRISRNLNQPIGGARPFPSLSMASSILPGTPLGNITQVESTGFSDYCAVWVSALMRRSRGLQFDVSYTWSRSRDTNSLNSAGFAVQNSYDIPAQFGLSDFDARHRFVVSAIYQLPFDGHALVRGWQIAAVVQGQSGNPVNLVTSNSTLTGMANTVRPDVVGPIRIVGLVDRWFDTSAFAAVDGFGNLGRNVVIGPPFHNTDVSVTRRIEMGATVEVRLDVFDLFNHANLGPPGNLVGSPTFGKITRTRFATGEPGSSRQVQLGVKLSF
jgi:hypothetical protein